MTQQEIDALPVLLTPPLSVGEINLLLAALGTQPLAQAITLFSRLRSAAVDACTEAISREMREAQERQARDRAQAEEPSQGPPA